MTGIEAASLRVVVRRLGDHGLASIGFDGGVTAGIDRMRLEYHEVFFVGVEWRTGEFMSASERAPSGWIACESGSSRLERLTHLRWVRRVDLLAAYEPG